MKKTVYIIIGLVIIVVSGWFVLSGGLLQPEAEQNFESFIEQTPQIKAELTISYGDGTAQTFQADFSEGATAFDILKNKARELGITLKTKDYGDMGIMVEAIGEKENGQGGKYWMYYVNGQWGDVASDKKILNSGDKVEFKFEKSPF